jgi:hypothetical protein
VGRVGCGTGVCRDRSCQTLGFFLLVEVRSLPGPQERGTEEHRRCGFWGVETEANRRICPIHTVVLIDTFVQLTRRRTSANLALDGQSF